VVETIAASHPGLAVEWVEVRQDAAAREGWLALHNVAYVVPLGAIVLVAVVTMRKLTLGERSARALKAISGTLLLVFGVLFLVAPDVLR
jgi:hypothetical protein